MGCTARLPIGCTYDPWFVGVQRNARTETSQTAFELKKGSTYARTDRDQTTFELKRINPLPVRPPSMMADLRGGFEDLCTKLHEILRGR